ncbi:MAG: LAGLIDADG family homing endonuclease [Patescibacteria group bacterium]|nr:LAGLIDADG family homing endonuclease [Patescibacteria group bacterium]
MKKINFDYIVGLVDGEGSFTVYVKNPYLLKKVKRRSKVEPRFYLKLIDKDKESLYKLKEFFGCGNVYFQRDRRANHRNCYRYEVVARQNLQKIIIPFFKKHELRLRSKAYDFKIFCKIMEKIIRKEHLTQNGLERIFFLKMKMH